MTPKPCIVAVGAHAADMEFAAGGTLLKHARQGWEVHLVHLTLGEKGSGTLTPAEYGAQKRREAEEAARLLQGTAHFLPYRDGELPVNDEVAAELAVVLRRLQPQVILTHWPGSIHLDHTNAYHLTLRAHFMAAIRHFEVQGLPPVRGCRIYQTDNWEDPTDFTPFVFVDITAEMADWEQACKAYAIGRGEGGFPYWDWYQARTRTHGILRQVGHAQAFAIDETSKYHVQELL
ncbi:MAG: PIG-L family deacetylase [Candidatus Latescibacterota bacterium]|jgi:LmbE family N-acetylglucosaminyl deacetylase